MALKQKSTTIVMGQSGGSTFPIHCNGVLDSEVGAIIDSLEQTNFYKSKYWSNVFEESTFTDKTMELPAEVANIAGKRDRMLRIQLKNDVGQSMFASFEVPVLKTGDTSDIETLVSSFEGQTIGTFGQVAETSWVLTK